MRRWNACALLCSPSWLTPPPPPPPPPPLPPPPRPGFLVRNRAYDLVHDGGSYSCLLGAAAANTAAQDDLFRSAGLGIAVRSDWLSGTCRHGEHHP